MKTFAPNTVDRIRDTQLSPEHFIRTFHALLQGVNFTGNPNLAITIDYGDGPVGPDELIPVITLSLRGNREEETRTLAETLGIAPEGPGCQEGFAQDEQSTAQDNAQVTAQEGGSDTAG